MIEVRLLNILAIKAGKVAVSLEAEPGLTVEGLMRELNLDAKAAQLIIINGAIGRLDSALQDGDEVTLSAVISGG